VGTIWPQTNQFFSFSIMRLNCAMAGFIIKLPPFALSLVHGLYERAPQKPCSATVSRLSEILSHIQNSTCLLLGD
jgi:hypothetical protein